MTETVPAAQSSSLRRLVPRIFSRSARRDDVEQLLRTVRTHHPKGDLSVIERAYAVASTAHEGQVRQSGEPYITHPVAVAQILADLGLGPRAIAAALLHDTVEDTGYGLDQLSAEFGDEVAMLVDGVTKLDKVKYGESAQAETVRKMIVAMSKDIRVLLIKLADRLHNARTWGFVQPEKAQKKATETLEIYAPLAHRLGIQTIKSELEDLSFAVLHPKLYAEIESLVKQRTPQREQYVHNVIEAVDADLRELRIRGRVMGRPKQLYSVYQKMVVRGREFDDIYDLIGIRILVGSVRDCYAVLGAIHARWTPLPGRFKDYVRLVPLESELKSGDVVEVFTSKNPDAGPSQDWLSFVKSTRARSKIRGWFTKERREEAVEQGKEAIARAMRRQNLPLQRLMSQDSFTEVAQQLKYEDVSALYAAVGEGHVSTQSVIEKVTALVSSSDTSTGPIDIPQVGRSRQPRGGDSGVLA